MPRYTSITKKIITRISRPHLREIALFSLSCLKSHKWPIAALTLWSLTAAALQSVMGVHVFSANKKSLSLVIGLFVSATLLRVFMGWYGEVVANKIFAREKVKFFEKLLDFLPGNRKLTKDDVLYTTSSDFSNLVNSLGTTAINLLSSTVSFATIFVFLSLFFPEQLTPLVAVGVLLASLSLLFKIFIRRYFNQSRLLDIRLFKREKSLIEGFEHHWLNKSIDTFQNEYCKDFLAWEKAQSKSSLVNSGAETLIWSAKYLFILALLIPGSSKAITMETVYWAFLLLSSGSQILTALQRFGITRTLWENSKNILSSRKTEDRRCHWQQRAISANHLSLYFGNKPRRFLVNNVNFYLKRDQTLLIQGPSGIGKTTLLRALVGLHRDYCGEITINPTYVFGYLTQDPYFEEGVAFSKNLNCCQKSHIPQSLIHELRLSDFFQKLPEDLSLVPWGGTGVLPSKGQQHRLALLRELLRSPDILLLDEPCAALDAETAKSVYGFLRHWSKGKTLIVADHNSLARKLLLPDLYLEFNDTKKHFLAEEPFEGSANA